MTTRPTETQQLLNAEAEIERWKELVSALNRMVDKRQAENAKLRVETERLTAMLAECNETRQRLRAALERIRDYKELRPGAIVWATDIARAALASEETPK